MVIESRPGSWHVRDVGKLIDDLIAALGCLFAGCITVAFLYWDWHDGWGWWTTGSVVVVGGWEYLKHKLGITGGDDCSSGGQEPSGKE